MIEPTDAELKAMNVILDATEEFDHVTVARMFKWVVARRCQSPVGGTLLERERAQRESNRLIETGA